MEPKLSNHHLFNSFNNVYEAHSVKNEIGLLSEGFQRNINSNRSPKDFEKLGIDSEIILKILPNNIHLI